MQHDWNAIPINWQYEFTAQTVEEPKKCGGGGVGSRPVFAG